MKTVGVDKKTHADLKRLAKQHRLSMGELVEAMTKYFKTSGEDPTEITSEEASPIEQIKNLDQRMVSFIRKQEQDYLTPIFEKIDGMLQEAEQEVENKQINDNIQKLNQNLRKAFNRIQKKEDRNLKHIYRAMKMIAYQKGILKGGSKEEDKIIRDYIADAREELEIEAHGDTKKD